MDGNLLDLRRREQAVLISLMTHAGKVVPKGRLMAEVFGFEEVYRTRFPGHNIAVKRPPP